MRKECQWGWTAVPVVVVLQAEATAVVGGVAENARGFLRGARAIARPSVVSEGSHYSKRLNALPCTHIGASADRFLPLLGEGPIEEDTSIFRFPEATSRRVVRAHPTNRIPNDAVRRHSIQQLFETPKQPIDLPSRCEGFLSSRNDVRSFRVISPVGPKALMTTTTIVTSFEPISQPGLRFLIKINAIGINNWNFALNVHYKVIFHGALLKIRKITLARQRVVSERSDCFKRAYYTFENGLPCTHTRASADRFLRLLGRYVAPRFSGFPKRFRTRRPLSPPTTTRLHRAVVRAPLSGILQALALPTCPPCDSAN